MSFSADELEDGARAATGLDDFGSSYYREGLMRTVAALNTEAELNDLGRVMQHATISNALIQRLKIVDTYKQHPEIADEVVDGPVVVLGLPRTGTTALGQLVSADPQFRSLRTWESQAPTPPPEAATQHTDPRIAQAARDGERSGFAAFRSPPPLRWTSPPKGKSDACSRHRTPRLYRRRARSVLPARRSRRRRPRCRRYEGCDFGSPPISDPGIAADIRDVRASDLAGFDAVVHLAAISNDPIGSLNPQATYSINAEGAVHLGRTAKAAGVSRFLFSSSCSLYGAAGSAPVAEDSAFNPVTPYGHSRSLADRVWPSWPMTNSARLHAQRHSLRIPPRLRADIVVNNLTGTTLAHGEVRLQSDGSPWRPLVHIEDISRAFLAALEAPREAIHNQAFNVGRDEDVLQIRDIALQVSDVLDAPVTFAANAGPDKRDYRVDFTKIGEVLPAYRPAWTVLAGIRELAHDMVRHGMAAADLDGPRFVRLARIHELVASGRLRDDLRLARPRR